MQLYYLNRRWATLRYTRPLSGEVDMEWIYPVSKCNIHTEHPLGTVDPPFLFTLLKACIFGDYGTTPGGFITGSRVVSDR